MRPARAQSLLRDRRAEHHYFNRLADDRAEAMLALADKGGPVISLGSYIDRR